VGTEGAICRFTTTADVRLSPVSLAAVTKTVDTKGRAALEFRFDLDRGVALSKLALSPLRLYLHAKCPPRLCCTNSSRATLLPRASRQGRRHACDARDARGREPWRRAGLRKANR